MEVVTVTGGVVLVGALAAASAAVWRYWAHPALRGARRIWRIVTAVERELLTNGADEAPPEGTLRAEVGEIKQTVDDHRAATKAAIASGTRERKAIMDSMAGHVADADAHGGAGS